LADEVADCAPAIAINEFAVQSRVGFVDIAVVNGELVGYEIKSDVDSTRRLSEQIPVYDAVFDRFYCVTTKRHIARVRALVPKRWGLIVAESLPVRLIHRRSARTNRDTDVKAVLYLLSRQELACVARALRLRGYATDDKGQLVNRLEASARGAWLRAEVRAALRARPAALWTERQRSMVGPEIRR
jgi:hypothetical protein